MMRVLLITYTLRNSAKDYDPLFKSIQSVGKWWHYIDTTWIVETTLTADQLAHRLLPFIETPDYLLVVLITREHQGWLPKAAWEWINSLQY